MFKKEFDNLQNGEMAIQSNLTLRHRIKSYISKDQSDMLSKLNNTNTIVYDTVQQIHRSKAAMINNAVAVNALRNTLSGYGSRISIQEQSAAQFTHLLASMHATTGTQPQRLESLKSVLANLHMASSKTFKYRTCCSLCPKFN